MHKRRLWKGLIGLGVLMGAGLWLAACQDGPKPVGDGDMSMGPDNAKITVIEYASVTCAHCADFNSEVMPELKAKYIDTNRIRYVYREFLTEPREISAAGALLARCSGKKNYFKVNDAIMRAQPEMFAGGTTDNALPVLLRIAQSVGMNEKQFHKCIFDVEGLKRIQDNVDKYLKEDDVTGTPTFFINGRKLDRKTGTIADFDEALAPLLKDQ